MSDLSSNDNVAGPPAERGPPDAHGQAAMLLVESLIHSLIAHQVLTVESAIEIVRTAAEVKIEVAEELGDTFGTMTKSLALLQAIDTSLNHDSEV